MQQGNQYHRFGYQPFNDPQAQVQTQPESAQSYGRQPFAPAGAGYDEPGVGRTGRLGALLSSPLAMTGVLIAAAVVFAGVLMVSTPSSEDIPQPIPIVQAESGPLKSEPAEAGGMEIANRDTTVFGAIEDKVSKDTARPVENLLESASSAEEQPMSKDELVAKLETQGHAPVAEAAPEEVPGAPAEDLKAPEAKTASAGVASVPSPEKGPDASPAVAMHEPGASPDTIAFVRGVLGKKDEKTAAALAQTHQAGAKIGSEKPELYANQVAAIEPSAGAAAAAPVLQVNTSPSVALASTPPAKSFAASSGTHYVQVVSVPSKAAADSEWKKFQKSFTSILSGVSHRVQEANLGEKGTYYRVQVGPLAEADAKSLCQQIKAQKPGGCLVVR